MGSYLSAPKTEKNSINIDKQNFKVGVSEMQGWRVSMEDAHIVEIKDDEAMFAVFDGHGGKNIAIFCSLYFQKEFKNTSGQKEENYNLALEQCFVRMDVCIQSYNGKQTLIKIQKQEETLLDLDFDVPYPENQPQENQEESRFNQQQYMLGNSSDNDSIISMGGCTSNVIFIKNNIIQCGNAGDSRCVLSRNGIASALSEDHKPDNNLERERIYNGGGTVDDGRVNGNLNLSRSIGDIEYKLNKSVPVEKQIITSFPDVSKEKLIDNDIIILACDGIWDCKTNQDVVDQINKKLEDTQYIENTDKICENLFDDCIAPSISSANGVGCDNMTCIIIKQK